MSARPGERARRFAADESGGVGLFALFIFVALCGVCGVAVDATNGYRYKALLQATADAAALAAAIDLPDTDAARATALEYAQANLDPSLEGFVLLEEDIVFGAFDERSRMLDRDAEIPDTIMVTARRAAANENALATSFLRMVGFTSMDVVATAGAMRYYPGCLSREGLITTKRVTMDTDNHFIRDFCIHGALGVSVKNDNSFEKGVKVTMEDLSDFQMPTGGFQSNPGLEEALGTDFYDLFILELVDDIVAGLKDPGSQWQPSYIDRSKPALTGQRSLSSIQANGLAPGRVHYLPCNKGQSLLELPGNMVFANVVIVTDCRITIAAKAQFHNVTMASSWKDPRYPAVAASAQTQWGKNDNCAPGGGARVITPGKVLANAQNFYFGGQFISLDTVSVNANTDGGSGVSVISDQDIALTSGHGYMGLCRGVDMETDTYRLTYFRLVI